LANRQTAVYFPNYIRTRLRVGYGTSGPTTAGATTDLFWRQAPGRLYKKKSLVSVCKVKYIEWNLETVCLLLSITVC
jgi:hypothetical protein